MDPRDFLLSFVKKEQVAKDAWTFSFTRPSDLQFLPGQYLRWTIDVPEPDNRGSSRLFSISSSPLNQELVSFTTRVAQSAYKKTLLSIAPGTEAKCFGPIGRFVLGEEDTRPRIFLAGGIGITPFRSMILYASEKQLTIPLTLFVSFSTVEGMIFYDELAKISTNHQNISTIYTVTKPEASSPPWNGEVGRISADLIKKHCPDFSSSLFYISGPPPMVDAMQAIVGEMSVQKEQVKIEKFVGY